MHMPPSRERELQKIKQNLIQSGIGIPSPHRTETGSSLAPFANCSNISFRGPLLQRVLQAKCVELFSTSGFPVVVGASANESIDALLGTATVTGSELVGFSPGSPDYQRALFISVCFSGRFSQDVNDTLNVASISELLPEIFDFKVDLPASSISLGAEFSPDGRITIVHTSGHVSSLGLQEGAFLLSVGGITVLGGPPMNELLTHQRGAEGRRFRTYEFRTQLNKLSCGTLFFHRPGSHAHHRSGIGSKEQRDGSELQTMAKIQMANEAVSAAAATEADITCDIRKELREKMLNNVEYVVMDTSKETNSSYKINLLPVRTKSKQDSKGINPLMLIMGEGSIFDLAASSGKACDAIQKMKKRHLGVGMSATYMNRLLRGDVAPKTATDGLSADQVVKIGRVTEELRGVTKSYNESVKKQSLLQGKCMQLENASGKARIANIEEIYKNRTALLECNKTLHDLQISRLGLLRIKAELFSGLPISLEANIVAQAADAVIRAGNEPPHPTDLMDGEHFDSELEMNDDVDAEQDDQIDGDADEENEQGGGESGDIHEDEDEDADGRGWGVSDKQSALYDLCFNC